LLERIQGPIFIAESAIPAGIQPNLENMGQLEFMIKQFRSHSEASSAKQFSSQRKIRGLEIFEKMVVFCTGRKHLKQDFSNPQDGG